MFINIQVFLGYFVKGGEASIAPLSTAECFDKGFSKKLICDSCSLLNDFGLDVLNTDCQKCCREVIVEKLKLAAGALLRICK